MITKFNKFILEKYNDLSDKVWNDKYDKKFGYYALNEKPLFLSQQEKEECKKLYGNISVGVVYHGGKINDESQYNELKRIKKNNGGYLDVNMISASPDFSTAESFAFYVKSYDEMTMIDNLRQSMKNGSSGEYGTFVLKIKPNPSNVIYSTFGNTKMKLSEQAETECILDGNVLIEDVIIHERLTKDNYNEVISKLSLNGLFNDFIQRWLNSNKLQDYNLTSNILNKLIKSKNDAEDFMLMLSTKNGFIFNNISKDIFINNKYLANLMDNIIFDDNDFYFNIHDKKIHISYVKDLSDTIYKLNKNILIKYVKEHINDGNIIEYSDYFTFDEAAGYLLSNVLKLNKIGVNLIPPIIKEAENKIYSKFNELILNKTLQTMSLKDVKNLEDFVTKNTYYIKPIIPLFSDKYKKIVLDIYNNFAHRFVIKTDEDRSKLTLYSKIVQNLLKTI